MLLFGDGQQAWAFRRGVCPDVQALATACHLYWRHFYFYDYVFFLEGEVSVRRGGQYTHGLPQGPSLFFLLGTAHTIPGQLA
jgi:hypothetical protein